MKTIDRQTKKQVKAPKRVTDNSNEMNKGMDNTTKTVFRKGERNS